MSTITSHLLGLGGQAFGFDLYGLSAGREFSLEAAVYGTFVIYKISGCAADHQHRCHARDEEGLFGLPVKCWLAFGVFLSPPAVALSLALWSPVFGISALAAASSFGPSLILLMLAQGGWV